MKHTFSAFQQLKPLTISWKHLGNCPVIRHTLPNHGLLYEYIVKRALCPFNAKKCRNLTDALRTNSPTTCTPPLNPPPP